MSGDLPIYKSGIKRSRRNKRFIIAFALLGTGFICYLNARLAATSGEPNHNTLSNINDHPSKQQSDYPLDTHLPDMTFIDTETDSKTDNNGEPSFVPDDKHPLDLQPTPSSNEQSSINSVRHYAHLVIVTSDTSASSMERRRLIRESYFGLRDNLLPCMVYNTDVYYKFLIHDGLPPSDTPLRRQYEAEKMEWNDIVELEKHTAGLQQEHILTWAETTLLAQGITYDYLILQDIKTFMQLDTIKQNLDAGVIGDQADPSFIIDKNAPTNFVWGNFGGDATDKDAVVIGSNAVKLALQLDIETTFNNKQVPLLTKMYNYYQTYMDFMEDEIRDGHAPKFIREDGPEGNHRFTLWENNVESVHSEDIAVTRIYQNQDFTELAYWTRLSPITVCYTPPSQMRDNKTPTTDSSLGDNGDDYDNVMDILVEELHPGAKKKQQQLDRKDGLESSSIAVVTSSFIYDACMEPSATRAAMNKRDYAMKHGYAFVARSAEFLQEATRRQRKTVWGKISVVEKVLPKYEWVFWLDMDAVVMDQQRTLESLLDQVRQQYPQGSETFDDQVDFVVSRPFRDPMINAGVFLIKNTPWSMAFLRDIQKTTSWYNRGPSYEQGAMWDVMRRPENKDKVFLLDRDDHTFNTFPSFYQPGDFVVHFAPDKCPNDATVKGLDAADKILNGGLVTKLDFD